MRACVLWVLLSARQFVCGVWVNIFKIVYNIYELEAPPGTHAPTQRITEDADDEQFLEEGSDAPQEQPLADDEVDPLDAFMAEMGQSNPETLPARPSQMPQKAEEDEDYADE